MGTSVHKSAETPPPGSTFFGTPNISALASHTRMEHDILLSEKSSQGLFRHNSHVLSDS